MLRCFCVKTDTTTDTLCAVLLDAGTTSDGEFAAIVEWITASGASAGAQNAESSQPASQVLFVVD